MGLQGYTFDRMKISPKADALLYHSMLDGNDRIVKCYKDELKVVATGLNTYISPGACIVQGRMIEIDEEMQLSVSANDSGYVCLVIDLTQNNTSTGEAGTPEYQPVNNQIRLEAVKELVQQDLHDGGQLYTFPLASFTSTGTTVALTKINHSDRKSEMLLPANGQPFLPYNENEPFIELVNGIVYIRGAFMNNRLLTASETGNTIIKIADIPEWAAPSPSPSGRKISVKRISQGSASAVFFLTIDFIAGKWGLYLSRYRTTNSNSFQDVPDRSFLVVDISYQVQES